ncbi:GUN4 domain-containing protein [Calothrix sp. FACHB-1219]|uniref:GUN4 domain-containing protein n=1 Tax=unclassified Calothrix TaxID=2619626 RepID=UPI00168725F3|nr:GUN4 domain-containing protein [Calothrix sp. FACHB-168]MBD2215507.1 GUN4 domain-containing protein [Calothrix sp. FACHB-1219]
MAKYALLIGMSEYESRKINNLPGVVKDIAAMQRVLQNSEIGGFDEVKFLSHPDSQVMLSEIEQLFMEKCQEDDVVLLYFSGHGYTDEDGNLYFLSRNTEVNSEGKPRLATAVEARLIHKNYMSRSKSKRQVLILDCCFSGAFAEGMSAKNIANLSIKNEIREQLGGEGSEIENEIREQLGGEGRAVLTSSIREQLGENEIREQLGGEGRAVLTSSTATQQSFEDQSLGGVYTRYLVEGIEKGSADSDNDGFITVAELHEYAKRKVQEEKPAMTPEIFPVKEGYTIRLAKAPLDDPQLEYRKEVEKYVKDGGVTDGEISELARILLDIRQSQLRLTSEEAKKIENEVLKPFREFQESLQKYEKALTAVLQKQPNLSDTNRKLLKGLQQILKLRDEDIAAIHNCLILISSETGVDYTKLRDLLAAGNWKDADMETYRVMIQALDKEEGDYLKSEELLNFPCTDLRTIDSLWVKYSNGRFGFSVQKEIYLRVGGKPDGEYNKEAWNKFGACVGWRVNGNWISYIRVTYDTSAPWGHLPTTSRRVIDQDPHLDFDNCRLLHQVFSRIETCKV